jgi:hypothetical protein
VGRTDHPRLEAARALRDAVLDRLRSVLKRHGRTLWWLHSGYALLLGVSVVLFAQKGFARARWLAASVLAAWLLVVALFRIFGSRPAKESFQDVRAGLPPENVRVGQQHEPASRLRPPSSMAPSAQLRFLVMTYVLKNLYQGMLFFLLPFYWKSSTLTARNGAFVTLLAVCAVVATLDVVFDEIVMRRRILASIFHGFALFATMNLLIPALFSNTRTLHTLIAAAAITVLAFWTLHVTPRALLRNRNIALLVATVAAGMGLAYAGRTLVPPVPMHLAHAAVGPVVLPDGRLVMEVKSLHTSAIRQLVAVTDVVAPGGVGDELRHVWRREGAIVRTMDATQVERGFAGDAQLGDSPRGILRLRSMLGAEKLPPVLAGEWTVDVETRDGQLVGRIGFRVID